VKNKVFAIMLGCENRAEAAIWAYLVFRGARGPEMDALLKQPVGWPGVSAASRPRGGCQEHQGGSMTRAVALALAAGTNPAAVVPVLASWRQVEP
jgi:hypothetical protein